MEMEAIALLLRLTLYVTGARQQHLEEELQDLHVPASFLEVPAPGVEPVASDQERISRRVLAEAGAHDAGEPRHVLRVVHDRNRHARLVRRHARKTLEHFEARDLDRARGEVRIG